MTVPRPVRCSDIEWRIYANLDGSNWTDISRDVLEAEGVDWDRGMQGGGPLDRTARAGTLTFVLNNSHANEAGILGRWSTGHMACRLGWDVGTPVRLDVAYQGAWQTQWIGRVEEIRPEHGILGTRRVFVAAKDWMEEAASHNLRGLTAISDATAVDIIEALVASIPIPPPGGTILDEGLDVFPIAFDDIDDGKSRALTEFGKLDRSGLSYTFLTRDSALRHMNRNSRVATTHNLFVLDGTMRDVEVQRSRRDVVNRIEVTVHPRRVGENVGVLWSLDSQPLIPPGAMVPFRGSYTDPDNRSVSVGGVNMQTPLVAGQDFTAGLQPAEVSGTPDTPATLLPNGAGFHTGVGGSFSVLADDDDNTGDQAEWGHARTKRSWTLTDIEGAEDNARVTGVIVSVRIKHAPFPPGTEGGSGPGFFVLYPGLRNNGIDLPLTRLGTTLDHIDGYADGIHTADFIAPLAPGGVVWNAAAANALEFWRMWNWGGALLANPILTSVRVRLLYAGTVENVDRTSDVSVVVAAGGSAAGFEVTNNGTDGVYLTRLQIRGQPVFEDSPVTSPKEDAASIAAIGEKTLSFDQPHQSDINQGVAAAEYLLSLFGGLKDRAASVTFLANLSEEHMHAALNREIGDRIGLKEEVTGLSAFTAEGRPKGWHIQSVAGHIAPGPVIDMTWGLSPADAQPSWHVGLTGLGEVGETTFVGPM